MYGTKELKEILTLIAEIGNGLGAALEDGKLSLLDARHFIGALTASGKAFSGLDKALLELKDLDNKEVQELIDHIKAELDLPQDELEQRIESGFELLKKAYDVYDAVRDNFISKKNDG